MREPYNDYLYRKRKEAGLHRIEVCRILGISKFLYHRYERGYSVPKGVVVERISELYGEDFKPYLEKESSYPAEIKRTNDTRLIAWLKKRFTHLYFRVLLILIPVLALCSIPAALIVDRANRPADYGFYSPAYETIQRKVAEEGRPYIDPLGNFNNRTLAFNFSEENTHIYASITAPVDPDNIDDMMFLFMLRGPYSSTSENNLRLSFQYIGSNRFEYIAVNNDTAEYLVETGYRASEYDFIVTSSVTNKIAEGEANFDFPRPDTIGLAGDMIFSLFFNGTIGESFKPGELDISSMYEDVLLVKEKGDNKVLHLCFVYDVLSFIVAPIGIVLATISLICFVYLQIDRSKEVLLEVGKEDVPTNRRLPLLVGSSAIRVIGSLLLLLGSTYVLLSIANRFGLISFLFAGVNGDAVQYGALNVFFLGVFFLYILGIIDDFTHQDRLYLRAIVVGGLALGIAVFQSLFSLRISYLENGVLQMVLSYVPPNIFVSIFMFHLCALFLFATPHFVNGKSIRVWRVCSIIPVMFTLGVFVVDQLSNFGVIPAMGALSYFLGSDQYGFIIVTYLFLFGNFIIKNYYKKKYGDLYLRGDIYALNKNLTLCIPALIFAVLDIVFYFIPVMRDMGFGDSYSLFFVALLMLFYRGHNDKNHLPALVLSNFVYGLGLVIAYFFTVALSLAYISLM